MNKRNSKTNKLNAKDLINIGIFTAIYIVTYMIVGILAGVTVIGVLGNTIVTSIFTGVIYMLMAVKVKKWGVFFVAGTVMGLLSLTTGNIYGALFTIAGAFLAELVANRRKYGKLIDLMCAFVITTLMHFIGYYLPMFLSAEKYLQKSAERWNLTPDVIAKYMEYINWPIFGVLILLNIAAAFLGAWIGVRILIKHFRKAGFIK